MKKNKNKNIVEPVMSTKKEKSSAKTKQGGTATKANAKPVGKKGTTKKRGKRSVGGTRETLREENTTGENICIPSTGNHTFGTKGGNYWLTLSQWENAGTAKKRKRNVSTTFYAYATPTKEPCRGTWFRRVMDAISKNIRNLRKWFFQWPPSKG